VDFGPGGGTEGREVTVKKPINPVTTAALGILRSGDFFAALRGTLSRAGLAKEEKVGVGVLFVMVSRLRANPLRLAISEKTEGGAKYVVRKVARLLWPGTTVNVFSEDGWSRFSADPEHKVAYVPDWSDRLDDGMQIVAAGNRIARISKRQQDGRIVETPDTVEAKFVCISRQLPFGFHRQRWLTMQLPDPPSSVPKGILPLDDDEVAVWREVQRLLQEQATLPIVLPDWASIVIEQACQKDNLAFLHLSAFLQAWQTMTLIRSFREEDDWEQGKRREMLKANFEDLAATSMLLRGVFREGHWFPSVKQVFSEIFRAGKELGVINPLTGRGVRYTRQDHEPVSWENVLEGIEDLKSRQQS
jgi:hypothetical protein